MNRPIGLAAQVLPELTATPWRTVELAAAAGFDRVGVTVDPESWTAAATRRVRDALRAGGLFLQDVEVIRIRGDFSPDIARLLDIAGELGAAYVIAVSLLDDPVRTREVLAAAAAHAAGSGVVPILEFGRFTSVGTIEEAAGIAGAAGIPILLDPLHLARSGGTAAAIAAIPPGMLPYAQICDAGPPPRGIDATRLLAEAREERRDLGDGELDLAGFVAALARRLPLMNEVRSAALARAVPDPGARARRLAATMRASLRRWDE